MRAAISDIEYYLPEYVLTTEILAQEFPEWSVARIDEKTGIRERHIAAPTECSSDLAVRAAEKLFHSGACAPRDIDYLLLCTQSPDYFLPTTACLLQQRLGLPTGIGAMDFNLGCSGFVYGLGLAQGIIETGQARSVLLLTAETYSKFLHPQDRGVRTIFGDAAAATLVRGVEGDRSYLGPYVYGTDGGGAENLIVRTGAMRNPRTVESARPVTDDSGSVRAPDNLYMNGPEIFNFARSEVPTTVKRLLERAGLTFSEIDLFVFHQANRYMLEHLRRSMRIPPDRFCTVISHCGNTVSSSIPIALKHAIAEGKLRQGQLAMLVGFGVGYSWGATIARMH
ncbi:MAG: ketoacyl-ACP synthase III [Acidobacteria bacterium]|nr:ketoacyl-ACP synthase III [Acidobacteriota bacterium]